MIKRVLALALTACLLFATAGCEKSISPVSANRVMLNTFVVITLYDCEDTAILNGCFDLIAAYEKQFSRTVSDSEISRLNRRETDTVSAETADLIRQSLQMSALSGGRFDITVEPLAVLWDFSAEDPRVPDPSEIQALLPHVGYRLVTVDEDRVTFDDGETQIDLGAIAKGYIADKVKAYLLENGVHSATLNLGGNVLCVGGMPSGKPFQIGIRDPQGERGDCLLTLPVSDRSVVTSGIYERGFEQNGYRYHHILDPETGYPVENELAAVTVVSDRSVDGDAFSTALMAMGLVSGQKLVRSTAGIEAVWQLKNGTVLCSDGLREYQPQTK